MTSMPVAVHNVLINRDPNLAFETARSIVEPDPLGHLEAMGRHAERLGRKEAEAGAVVLQALEHSAINPLEGASSEITSAQLEEFITAHGGTMLVKYFSGLRGVTTESHQQSHPQ